MFLKVKITDLNSVNDKGNKIDNNKDTFVLNNIKEIKI